MASSPSILDARPKTTHWVPALFAIIVICCESQKALGGDHTSLWLAELLVWTGHHATAGGVEVLNHVLRKSGHFAGYGLLGLCFARGWMSILRKRISATWTRLRLRAGACGVASAFVVASCDEFHQSFLPNRTATFTDVLLDTCGAITVGLIAFGILSFRRNRLIQPAASSLTTLGLSLSSFPHVARRESIQRMRRSAGRRVHAVRDRIRPNIAA